MVRYSLPLILIASAMISACGNKTDTGRNADPSKWPTNRTNSDSGNVIPGHGDHQHPAGNTCAETSASRLPPEITALCEESIKPEPAFKDIYPIICEQGKVIPSLTKPSCGWDGNPQTMNQFIHFYYMQKDKTRDYEDIHMTAVHSPVPVERFLTAIRLAFENYDEFKRQGFQWVSGTREHRNLSGTTWEQGVDYRFRADKDVYEVGYQGHNKLFKLSPDLYAHLNHATGDFARIAEFSQVVLYQRQADNSTVSFKIERRRISSQGLYDRAKRSSAEMIRDVMEKGYKNAVKP